jgi:anti-sigma regulatory factor (Ser/Thr protein kinase)
MKGFANVRLELDSRPESVTLVRAMLSGIAEWREFDPELVNDLKTAVSEACNNVIVHAYDNVAGPLAVHVHADRGGLTTTVRDRGVGLEAVNANGDGIGVGLAVISALAARAEFATPLDGGTEVRMWFPAGVEEPRPLASFSGLRYVEPWASEHRDGEGFGPAAELWGDVRVTVSPVSLTANVLGRLARALAATGRFSFDRFSDVYLVADAMGAHAQRSAASDRISFSLVSAPKRLELSIGPFRTGTSASLQRRPGNTQEPESPLWLLADEIKIDDDGGSEMVHVVMHDRGTRARNARDY